MTARRYERFIEEDFEDIVQILRIKCFRALRTFNPTRSTMTVDRYVFSCMKNQVKDLLKKRKRFDSYIEDYQNTQARPSDNERQVAGHTAFDAKYLAIDDPEPEEDSPLNLPADVTDEEREVCVLMVEGYTVTEIAAALSVRPGYVKELVGSLQTKLIPLREAL